MATTILSPMEIMNLISDAFLHNPRGIQNYTGTENAYMVRNGSNTKGEHVTILFVNENRETYKFSITSPTMDWLHIAFKVEANEATEETINQHITQALQAINK